MFDSVRMWRSGAIDVAPAVAVAGVGVAEVVANDWSTPTPMLAVLVAAVAFPLALRRRLPLLSTLLVVAAVAMTPRELDLPMFAFLGLLVAAYSVGSRSEFARAVIGGSAVLSLFGVGWLVDRAHHEQASPSDLLFVAVVFGGAWTTARLLRERRLRNTALEERSAQLEATRDRDARLAVAQERSRIARELHDVIAHSVSVMVVQAGAAEHLLGGDDERVRESLQAIQHAGRQAVEELRQLLGILREGDDPLVLSPQPGLAAVGSLVEQAAESGLTVQIDVHGTPAGLPPGLDLSAYRIIQEALTNVRKHSRSDRACVTIHHHPDAVEIEVRDPGPLSGERTTRTGHGLVGMRERVSLYGGTLDARPIDAGFVVRARLPLGGVVR